MAKFTHPQDEYLKCQACFKLFFTKTGLEIHSENTHGQTETKDKTHGQTETKDKEPQQSRVHTASDNKETGTNESTNDLNLNQVKDIATIQRNLNLLKNTIETQLKTLKCENCAKLIDSNSSLRCEECLTSEKMVASNSSLNEQLKPYQCLTCAKNYIYKKDLSKPVQCMQCEKSLGSHIDRQNPDPVNPKFQQCQQCQKYFSRKFILMHMRIVHEKSESHQSQHCDLSFSPKTSLEAPLVTVHEKLNPHSCLVCKNSFAHKSSLFRHIRTVHETLEPHDCSMCKESFAYKYTLRRHVKAVHEKLKAYDYVVCQKLFRAKTSLQRHTTVIREKDKLQPVFPKD